MIHQPCPKVIRAAPIGASGPCTIYRRISRFFRPEIPSAQARTGIAKLWFQSRLLTRKKLGSIPKCNRMTHRPHSVKVEAQVVNRVENLSQYFVRCIEMPKISSRVPGTNTAAAVRIEWASVSSVACLLDRNFSFRRKQQTMPRRPSGQNTIHHVDTKIGVFDNLFRCTHTHKIAGGLGGEMLNGGFDNLTCKFARLTDTKPANCVSGKSDLDCSLRSAQRTVSSFDERTRLGSAGYSVHSSNAMMMSAPSPIWASVAASGLRNCVEPSRWERNVTPSSVNLRSSLRLKTWNPPESVRIARSHDMNRCSPSSLCTRAIPRRRYSVYVLPSSISTASS